jgi:DNA-binding MarR family transcriptional regulator
MQLAAPSIRTRTQSVESVMQALMSIGRLIRQRGQGETLDPGTFWLLKNIAANGSMRVTDIAQHANLDVSTVSRHVAQLHQAGLIERTPDPDDRRAQRVRLSETGQHKLSADLRARTTLLERSLENWTQEDLEQLDRVMTRFVADVDTLTENLETT